MESDEKREGKKIKTEETSEKDKLALCAEIQREKRRQDQYEGENEETGLEKKMRYML